MNFRYCLIVLEILNYHNKVVHEGRGYDPQGSVDLICLTIYSSRKFKATSLTNYHQSMLSVNFDASINRHPEEVHPGVVVRLSEGEIVTWYTKKVRHRQYCEKV